MKERGVELLEPKLAAWSQRIGALAVVVGIIVACGWIADLAPLRRLVPDLPQMKFNVALGFVLAGTASLLLARRVRPLLARALALVVALLGLATLGEYVFGWELGIDELFVADRTGEGSYPGRIPVPGAINFLLLGLALFFLDRRWRVPHRNEGVWPAQWLALLVALTSFIVLLGFIYDAASLYRPQVASPAALHGILLFLLLAAAALLARPERGLIARVVSTDAGALLLRRLLPAVIVIPPMLGWLRLQGQEAGLYGNDLGLAIFATTNVLLLSVLVWFTAARARTMDAERRRASEKLQRQVARLDLLNHITHAIGERQDLRSIFQVAVRSLVDQLPVDFACVGMREEASAGVVKLVSVGSSGGDDLATTLTKPEYAVLASTENGLARALQGTMVYEPDIGRLTFPFFARLSQADLRALVIAPLRAESTVFGVLMAARRESGSFSSADCEFLRQLSAHVALATHQAQLYAALHAAYEDLRQSQHTLAQQERLRALGQMASGIAHDVNNALSPMALYTESLLEREQGLSPEGRQQLGIISRAIDDVASTVARMREFYRPREAQMLLTPIDLNRLVREVIDLTRARWRDQPQGRGIVIELHTDLVNRLPVILGVEPEIRDALTNLIFNAVDAMPAGGDLTISTAARGRGTGEARQVCLSVSDTGIGMDEPTRQHCLEPFFSTKGERGTGLGLAMVYGMAQRHSAEIEIDSTPGVGTTLRLLFPAAPETTASSPQTSLSLPALKRLRILIVDDDPLLLQSLRQTLEGDGHVVHAAEGGKAGIDAFLAAQARAEPFALVITDLGMPYVDGRKVVAAVRAAASSTPIILLTGWGQRLDANTEFLPQVDRILAKPPKLRELRAALAEVAATRA